MGADMWLYCPFCQKKENKGNDVQVVRVDGIYDIDFTYDGELKANVRAHCRRCGKEWEINTSVKAKQVEPSQPSKGEDK